MPVELPVASRKNVRELKDTDLRNLPAANGGWDGVNDEREAVGGSPEGRRLQAGTEAREDKTAGRVGSVDAVHAAARAPVNESAREATVAQPEDEASGRCTEASSTGARARV